MEETVESINFKQNFLGGPMPPLNPPAKGNPTPKKYKHAMTGLQVPL